MSIAVRSSAVRSSAVRAVRAAAVVVSTLVLVALTSLAVGVNLPDGVPDHQRFSARRYPEVNVPAFGDKFVVTASQDRLIVARVADGAELDRLRARGVSAWKPVFGNLERVTVPYVVALPLLAMAPGWWLVSLVITRIRRSHRDADVKPCPACGYDLRASPARCPECGAAG